MSIEHQKNVATVAGGVVSVVASVALGADPVAISTWFFGVIDGLIERIQAGYMLNRNSSLSYLTRHAALNGASVDPVPGSLDVRGLRRRLEIVGPIGFKSAIAAGQDTDEALRHMSTRMSGLADEVVRNGDRDVITQSAAHGRGVVGWRRRLSGRACGFCAMLASRGAVYRDRKTATIDRSGERYHEHCHCWAEPLYSRQQEPPEVQLLQRQWQRVTAGRSGRDAQRVWRRHWEQRATPRARRRFEIRQPAPQPRPTGQVRKILADAQSPADVSRVLADEYQRFTGRTIRVDLHTPVQTAAGQLSPSVATAREHAEGVLRVIERYPDIVLDEIVNERMLVAYAQFDPAGRRLRFSAWHSSVEHRGRYLDDLIADRKASWHPYDTPTGMAVHEMGHALDEGLLGGVIRERLDDVVERLGGTEAVQRISGYAMKSPEELVGEAFADAILRGDAAAPLSKAILGMLDEAYILRARGARTALGPLATAPDLSRLSVTRLRSLVTEHGVTVPTGLRKPALVKLVDDLDSGVSAQVARDRAVLSIIDERRVSADALIRASELGPQSSPRAMQHVGSVLRRDLPDELQTAFRPLIEALDAADFGRVQAAIPVVARATKLKQVGGAVGDVKPFRAGEMQWIGDSRAGQAFVIRPGYSTTFEGTTTVLQRAAVAPASAEQIARLAPAKAAKKAAAKKAAPTVKSTAPQFDLRRAMREQGVSEAQVAEIRELIRVHDTRIFIGDPKAHDFVDRAITLRNADPALARFYQAHPDIYNHLAQARSIDKAWTDAWKARVAEGQRKATAAIRRAVADNPIAVRQSTEAQLRQVLDDGRLKTQFETRTSAGFLDTELRADYEAMAFGLPQDLPVAQRPVYGYVAVGGLDADTGERLSQFGEIRLVLRDRARGRTTVTVGDSLDRRKEIMPMPIDEADWHAVQPSLADMRYDSKRFRSAYYVEAQIHGGVTVDDIAEVVFRQQPEAATVAALRRAGVAWRVEGRAAAKATKAAPAKKATAAKRAPAKATPRKAPAPPVPERMSLAALKTEVQRAGVPPTIAADLPKPALTSLTRRLREGVDVREETGRLRQAIIDRQRALADALAEAAELLDNGATAEVLARRAASRLKRVEELVSGWPAEAPIRSLVTAMRTGNPATIRRAIATAERRGGLRRLGGAAGDSARFDRAAMTPIAGARIVDDATVRVVRPGYEVEIGGQRVVISRPVVEEISEAPRIDRTLTPDDILRQETAAKTQALAAPTTKLQELPPRGQAAQVLKYYQLHGDQHMNGLLRRGRVGVPRGQRVVPTPEQVQESIARLRGLMDESRLTEGITVYRGMSGVRRIFRGADEPGSLVGRTFRDKGFVSTSADRRVAMQFTEPDEGFAAAEGVLLEIRVPPGVGAIQISNDDYIGIIPKGWQSEREILLEDGLRYRVISDEMVADVYAGPGGVARTTDPYRHVVVEVIP